MIFPGRTRRIIRVAEECAVDSEASIVVEPEDSTGLAAHAFIELPGYSEVADVRFTIYDSTYVIRQRIEDATSNLLTKFHTRSLPSPKQMTRRDLRRVFEVEPLLTTEGIGLGNRRIHRSAVSAWLKRERNYLFDHLDECNHSCQWLAQRSFSRRIETTYSSFAYKHMVECSTGQYISNGSFVAAVIHCEILYEICREGQSIMIPVSIESLEKRKLKGVG